MENQITIKTEVTVKSEIDVTITLPYYCKSNDGVKFAKIHGTGAYDCIRVTKRPKTKDIEETMPSFVLSNDYTPCTEQDFLTAFNEASNHLSKLANS